jgi:hypothetical protein
MIEGIANGTGREIKGKSASLSGWMNQQTREVKLIPKKSFKSGKNKCKEETKLAVARLLQKRRGMQEGSLPWTNPRSTLSWLSILVLTSFLGCGRHLKTKAVQIQASQSGRGVPSL